MKYTVYAEFTAYYSAEIEAESNEEALDIADGMASTDFKSDTFEYDDWRPTDIMNEDTGEWVNFN